MAELIEGTDRILDELMAGGRADLLAGTGYPCGCAAEGVARQAIDPKKMTADFVIVTYGKKPNRNGWRVKILPDDEGDGLLLDNYQKNPVVMFDHGMTGIPFPIGRTVQVKLSRRRAVARAQFSQSLPEAVQIFALIEEGIVSAASIHYIPLKARRVQVERKPLGDDVVDLRDSVVWEFLTSELLEWGPVGIPADPQAVRLYLDRGHIHGEKLTPAMRRVLASVAGPRPVWSPGWTQLAGSAQSGEEGAGAADASDGADADARGEETAARTETAAAEDAAASRQQTEAGQHQMPGYEVVIDIPSPQSVSVMVEPETPQQQGAADNMGADNTCCDGEDSAAEEELQIVAQAVAETVVEQHVERLRAAVQRVVEQQERNERELRRLLGRVD